MVFTGFMDVMSDMGGAASPQLVSFANERHSNLALNETGAPPGQSTPSTARHRSCSCWKYGVVLMPALWWCKLCLQDEDQRQRRSSMAAMLSMSPSQYVTGLATSPLLGATEYLDAGTMARSGNRRLSSPQMPPLSLSNHPMPDPYTLSHGTHLHVQASAARLSPPPAGSVHSSPPAAAHAGMRVAATMHPYYLLPSSSVLSSSSSSASSASPGAAVPARAGSQGGLPMQMSSVYASLPFQGQGHQGHGSSAARMIGGVRGHQDTYSPVVAAVRPSEAQPLQLSQEEPHGPAATGATSNAWLTDPEGLGREGRASRRGGAAARRAAEGGRKSRFLWDQELHRAFVAAVFDVGVRQATPKTLFDAMRQILADGVPVELNDGQPIPGGARGLAGYGGRDGPLHSSGLSKAVHGGSKARGRGKKAKLAAANPASAAAGAEVNGAAGDVPQAVQEMAVLRHDGCPSSMTSEHIKSHLQKFRGNVRRSRDAFLQDYARAMREARARANEEEARTGAVANPPGFSTFPMAVPAHLQPSPPPLHRPDGSLLFPPQLEQRFAAKLARAAKRRGGGSPGSDSGGRLAAAVAADDEPRRRSKRSRGGTAAAASVGEGSAKGGGGVVTPWPQGAATVDDVELDIALAVPGDEARPLLGVPRATAAALQRGFGGSAFAAACEPEPDDPSAVAVDAVVLARQLGRALQLAGIELPDYLLPAALPQPVPAVAAAQSKRDRPVGAGGGGTEAGARSPGDEAEPCVAEAAAAALRALHLLAQAQRAIPAGAAPSAGPAASSGREADEPASPPSTAGTTSTAAAEAPAPPVSAPVAGGGASQGLFAPGSVALRLRVRAVRPALTEAGLDTSSIEWKLLAPGAVGPLGPYQWRDPQWQAALRAGANAPDDEAPVATIHGVQQTPGGDGQAAGIVWGAAQGYGDVRHRHQHQRQARAQQQLQRAAAATPSAPVPPSEVSGPVVMSAVPTSLEGLMRRMEVRQTMHRRMMEQQVDSTGKYSEAGAAAATAHATQPDHHHSAPLETAVSAKPAIQRSARTLVCKSDDPSAPAQTQRLRLLSETFPGSTAQDISGPAAVAIKPEPHPIDSRRRSSSAGLGLSFAAPTNVASSALPAPASEADSAPVSGPANLFDFLSEQD